MAITIGCKNMPDYDCNKSLESVYHKENCIQFLKYDNTGLGATRVVRWATQCVGVGKTIWSLKGHKECQGHPPEWQHKALITLIWLLWSDKSQNLMSPLIKHDSKRSSFCTMSKLMITMIKPRVWQYLNFSPWKNQPTKRSIQWLLYQWFHLTHD